MDFMDFSIRSVAVIGAGVMGRQVAWACVHHGLTVLLFDTDATQAQEASKQIREWLGESRTPDQTREALARFHVSEKLGEAVATADFVFENVPELVDLKRSVYAQAELLMRKDALLGSNASSIPWSPLARDLARPENFFLANFSSPRSSRLVEYMGGAVTPPRTRQAALQWIRDIGMIPVPVEREIMGYAGNRIWRAIKKESLFLADRGYATPENIDRAFMLGMGTSLGPFALMDHVGLHSVLKVEEAYHQASGDPSDRPPQLLLDKVSAGALGVCTGRGFYTYPNPAYESAGWLENAAPK
jgi:3-hydroxybutyryl-CoA dehydrogenase